jgi:Fur family peroxide stress response transcriptional regulator
MADVERKYSKKREAILGAIQSTSSHPGARWVYDVLKPRIPDLSLGTVYRNITLFREEGRVISVGVVDGEERFDGRVDPHPHLVCCSCGRVEDLPCPDETSLRLLSDDEARSKMGFTIDYRRTVFYGLCPDCSAREENPAEESAI